MSPAYARPLPSSNLSVKVHGTGPLVPHLLLTNPVVRLHVVSAATGEYLGMGGVRSGGEVGARQLLDGTQQAEVRAVYGQGCARHPIGMLEAQLVHRHACCIGRRLTV